VARSGGEKAAVRTVQIVLVILIGLPIAGSILLLGAVLGGRAAMRNAIESGRVYPQCPHPNCPYRQLGPAPKQAVRPTPRPEQ
jgi:hypothetical protein